MSGTGAIHRSQSARTMDPHHQPQSNNLGDEVVPDLRLDKRLVDSVNTSVASIRRQTVSSVSLPGSYKTPFGSFTTSARGNAGRSFSGPASPASMFLGRLNTQLSSPTEANGRDFLPFSEHQQSVGAYKLGRVIGTGGFSVVREARSGDKLLAVKIIDKRTADLNLVDHERDLWHDLHHKHILPLLDVQDTTNSLYLFTSCITEGSLHDKVRQMRQSENRDCYITDLKSYVKQLVDAIYYLHNDAKVVHRDIKLENCLLDPERGLQLCDFGLSQYIDEQPVANDQGDFVGPAPYSSNLAPWNGPGSNRANDYGASEDGILPSRNSSLLNLERYRSMISTSSAATTDASSAASSSTSAGTTLNPATAGPNTSTGSISNTNTAGGPAPLGEPFSGYQRTRTNSVSSAGTMSRRNSLASSDATRQGGSMHYAAPEILSSDGVITPAVDIWALGVLVYTAFTAKYPWHHPLTPKLRNLILTTDYDDSGITNETAKRLVKRALVKDVSERADIAEIRELVSDW